MIPHRTFILYFITWRTFIVLCLLKSTLIFVCDHSTCQTRPGIMYTVIMDSLVTELETWSGFSPKSTVQTHYNNDPLEGITLYGVF